MEKEMDHGRGGFKGFPGHRTLGAQRELARTMLTWIVVLSETLAAERRTHVADRERSEQAQNALLARLRVVDEDRTVG